MLEIACFNKESAVITTKAGADRIEFCAGFEVGGTTPSLHNYMELKKNQSERSLMKKEIFQLIFPIQIPSRK